jgi:hypothetical protein
MTFSYQDKDSEDIVQYNNEHKKCVIRNPDKIPDSDSEVGQDPILQNGIISL